MGSISSDFTVSVSVCGNESVSSNTITVSGGVHTDAAPLSGAVTVPYTVPQAEYMYGCTATAVGMLLGYYDRFGYMGYDVSDLIDGEVELNARGLDGNKYDMDAFDTVLGSAIASHEYVTRFYETDPEEEYPYTYTGNTPDLNVSVWNCIADYLGTGQYWRGNEDLSTTFFYSTLNTMKKSAATNFYSSGPISVTVPAYHSDFRYGLDLYVAQAGYHLDAKATRTESVDTNGGTFSFEDYKNEIDAGRVVIVHIVGHSMIGYGYDASTNEIIFDDTYDHDCRMEWGGKYEYADALRDLDAITVIQFDTSNLNKIIQVGKPKVSADITVPTNTNVIVSASCDDPNESIQYSYDQNVWNTYTSGISCTENCTIYFRSTDGQGNFSNTVVYSVSNIDRIAPNAPTAKANITEETSQDVIVSAVFSKDSVIKQYSLDGILWEIYNSGIVMTENGTVRFRGIDEAGNISEVTTYVVTNINEEVVPEEPEPEPDPLPVVSPFQPPVPTGLSAKVKKYSVSLAWNKVPADKYVKVSYDVSVDDKIYHTNSNKFTCSNLSMGEHTFAVRALFWNESASAWSSSVTRTIVDVTPPKTGALTVKQSGNDSILLTWDPATDNVGIDHYIVTCGEKTVRIDGKDIRSYEYSGLAVSKKVTASITAYDTSGIAGKTVKKTIKVEDRVAPSQVTGLQAKSVDNKSGGILSWNAANDNVGVNQYLIAIEGQKTTFKSKTTSFKIKKLAAGHYKFTVTAVDKAKNQSTESDQCEFTVADVIAPKIKKLSAKVSKDNAAAISWDAVDETQLHRVEFSLCLNGKEIDYFESFNGKSTYTASELSAGVYSLQMRAIDLAGNSAVKNLKFTVKEPKNKGFLAPSK